MSVWHPPPFIQHMEGTEMQRAYKQSRTKGSFLVGGKGWGCVSESGGAGGLDEEISPHLLHYVAPAQEAHWQL